MKKIAFQTALLLAPFGVHAATLDTFQGVLGTVVKVAGLMGQLLMVMSIIVVLWAAFQYLTAGGSEEKVENATKTLTYAVIGIVVGLLAFSVAPIVNSIING